MKYNCSEEFDLNLIYKKLTHSRQVPTVKANKFFEKRSELELLQIKMERLMSACNTIPAKQAANKL